jgi:hypothetical protein
LRQRLFSISPAEATFARRGFAGGNAQSQQRLEKIGKTFLQGYHSAIATPEPEYLLPQLQAIETEWQGFAFEGAAMGLALLDYLTPWKGDRLVKFLESTGGAHIYMTYVGIGWALARLPWGMRRYGEQLNRSHVVGAQGNAPAANPQFPDSLLGWLAIDGYGFHQGYFYWRKYIEATALPEGLSGYACRVFDQGLGRSLWFVKGADSERIVTTIGHFPTSRHSDLWSGIGLACTYAGGVEREALENLKNKGKSYLPQIAQGAAFAARARQRAGNLTDHTEMACQVLWGMSAEAVAEIPEKMLVNLHPEGKIMAYEIWRRRIQAEFLTVEARG